MLPCLSTLENAIVFKSNLQMSRFTLFFKDIQFIICIFNDTDDNNN